MSESFNLEIISPSKTLIQSEALEVLIPAFEGDITFLKNHISFVTFLRPGILEVKKENKVEKFYVEEGTVEFSKNNLLILSSTVKNLKEISKENVIKMIDDAKKNIANDEINDKEKYQLSHKIDTLENIN